MKHMNSFSNVPQLIPLELVRTFHRHILNIHPALLPAFGGAGYYGARCQPTPYSCSYFDSLRQQRFYGLLKLPSAAPAAASSGAHSVSTPVCFI